MPEQRKHISRVPNKLKQDLGRSSFKLICSSFIVITIWCSVHHFLPEIISEKNSDILDIFYSIYGVLYAIIAAFLLVEVLTNYNSLHSYMEEEINELQDIRDFVKLFENDEEDHVKKVLKELKDYVLDIKNEEWEDMSKAEASAHHDTTKELYEIFQEIKKINTKNEAENHIIGIMLGKMASLTSIRTKRVGAASKRLPFRLNILLNFMSFILIAGTVIVPCGSELLSLALVMALTISVHLLHMVINDLNNPFEGVWKMEPKMLEDFITTLEQ